MTSRRKPITGKPRGYSRTGISIELIRSVIPRDRWVSVYDAYLSLDSSIPPESVARWWMMWNRKVVSIDQMATGKFIMMKKQLDWYAGKWKGRPLVLMTKTRSGVAYYKQRIRKPSIKVDGD